MTTTAASVRQSSVLYEADTSSNNGGSTRHSTALSNKLTSVLSSSYADSEIRDALKLYDARYGQNGLDGNLDLKFQAQKEVIEGNARIVDDFSKVAKQLDRVGTLIATLNHTCDEIRRHVLAAKQETAPMLEEASALLAQKQETEKKQQLLDSFCKHFLVSDEDLTTLTSSAESVNERFFEVLARVKQIHKDCELLLGYENQRLGLELMEQTTRNLNAGYKKLFNSTLRDFKGLDLEDPYTSASIRRSLRALSERPALFQSCLDSFAEARQSTVSDAFQTALTDSTIGAARAIDFSTHDPLRYIGDMLAWVHSATVSEMEALESLFISDADEISRGLHSGLSADPFSVPTGEQDEPFDGHEALNSLISRNMASISHTLAQRISVTIRNLSDPVDIYKAYNILSLYTDMFKKLIQRTTNSPSLSADENTVLSTLTDLQSQTFTHFQTTNLEHLTSSIDDEPNINLSPPETLSETLNQFTKIAQTRGPILDNAELNKLYTTLLRPVLESCAALSEILEEPGPTGAAHVLIYKLNYLSPLRDTLLALSSGPSPIEAAQIPLNHAKEGIHVLQASLTQSLQETFISTSALDELRDVLDETHAGGSARRARKSLLRPSSSTDMTSTQQQEADPELLLETLAARLDTFLASALMDAQEELSKLADREIATSVIRSAVSAFCEEFETLVGRLEQIDEDVERETLAKRMGRSLEVNGELEDEADSDGEDAEEDNAESPTLREVYPRTLEEVRALLS